MSRKFITIDIPYCSRSHLTRVPNFNKFIIIVDSKAVFLLITINSSSFRRQNYVIFWYTHHLAFPFIILLLLHNYG